MVIEENNKSEVDSSNEKDPDDCLPEKINKKFINEIKEDYTDLRNTPQFKNAQEMMEKWVVEFMKELNMIDSFFKEKFDEYAL